ncbi:helix-turn-helix domain-containing protein [Streptomyces sp. NPDC056738]|uniref:helix-turn-helix domain-containing protein n=1 Tax=Streptomyces sp. NPDC056738 TaxID=3345933 RepID=UPI0036A948C5
MSNDDDRVQSARNAWVNALRAETLRVGRRIPEVARVATVGMWIATYADADGSNAFPGRDTLATLSGCSQETVTRAVKVLMGVGLLARRRRPNASSMYQLLMPLGGGVDWAPHMHHMTDTRQRKAHAKKKAADIAQALGESRTASTDAVENPSDSVRGYVPDSVRSGGSELSRQDPDRVHGRPRKASVDAVRTASVAGVYQYTPTSGRDPIPDHTLAGLSPQPQPRAGEAVKDESSTGQRSGPGAGRSAALAAVRNREPLARCTEPDCGIQLPYGASGRCAGCTDYLASTERHSA